MSPLKCTALAVGSGRPRPATSWKIAGIASAPAARSSISACTPAAVRSNTWRGWRRPPTSIDAPSTSRMLPRMEPTSEALTTSWRPSCSANSAMISSGALPNVTLSSPPTPGPERAASSSVALPISAAVGITPSAEVVKISAALACARSRAIAMGMKGTRRYGHPSPLRRKRRACCTSLTLHKRPGSRLAPMRRRTFGTTNLETSAVGFGTWALGSDWWGEHESPDALVARALDLGVTFFDTGDTYGQGLNEELVGEALARSGRPRDAYELSTK